MIRSTTMPWVLGLMLVGCASTRPAPEPEATSAPAAGEGVRPFFPLAVGNVWRYQGSMLGQPVEREIEIVSEDAGWFVDSEGERYRVDAEGLRGPERYLLKAPLQEGAAWKAVVSTSSTEYYEIAEVGVTVRVPAGTFNGCLKVVSRNRLDDVTTLFKEDLFCPGVGLVKLRTWADVAGKGQQTAADIELTGFELAGAASQG